VRAHTMGFGSRWEEEWIYGNCCERSKTASSGTPELDSEFAAVFPSAPRKVTRSIDAAVQLLTRELPGWWWTFGYCSLSNVASLHVPSSSKFPYAAGVMGRTLDRGLMPYASSITPNGVFGLMTASTATCTAAHYAGNLSRLS
jgi:hypothetical protein